jgi:hypothetical protein
LLPPWQLRRVASVAGRQEVMRLARTPGAVLRVNPSEIKLEATEQHEALEHSCQAQRRQAPGLMAHRIDLQEFAVKDEYRMAVCSCEVL